MPPELYPLVCKALIGLIAGAVMPPLLYPVSFLRIPAACFNVMGFLYYCPPAWLLILHGTARGNAADMPFALILLLMVFGGAEYLTHFVLRALIRRVTPTPPNAKIP